MDEVWRWLFAAVVVAIVLVVGYPLVFGDAGPFGFLAECQPVEKLTRSCSYPNIGAVLIGGGIVVFGGLYFAWWWRYQRGRRG